MQIDTKPRLKVKSTLKKIPELANNLFLKISTGYGDNLIVITRIISSTMSFHISINFPNTAIRGFAKDTTLKRYKENPKKKYPNYE